MNSSRRSSWFKLASIDDCETAVRVAALVAMSNAVVALVALVVYFAQATAPDWIVVPSALFHCAVTSVLALLVLRKNRAASVALLVYLVSSSILLWWLGHPEGRIFQVTAVLVPAVFLVFGSLAVLATFKWHEQNRLRPLSGGIARAA